MKKPIRVAVTGPAGNIGYSLLFRIAAGDMFGPDQPVILQLLDRASPESQQKVTGVMMELDDCAFPLLAGLENSPEATTAFRDADVALLVGARPRSKGMERADLLNANAEIFVAQGRALNEAASRDCKVLVVGNPCNTNAWIAMKSAPDLKPENFTSMLRLDQNRNAGQGVSKRHHARCRLGQPLPGDVPGSRPCAHQGPACARTRRPQLLSGNDDPDRRQARLSHH